MRVVVSEINGVVRFSPGTQRRSCRSGWSFPGSLVEPAAYAPLGHALAAAGYQSFRPAAASRRVRRLDAPELLHPLNAMHDDERA
jgi:hypothetical protein